MKLEFIKIDKIDEEQDRKIIHIPAGGIEFRINGNDVALAEPIQIEATHTGEFKNIVRYVQFAVYQDQSLNVIRLTRESLFGVVAHEQVYHKLMTAMQQRCKVAPMYKPLDAALLLKNEYENSYMQLLEG